MYLYALGAGKSTLLDLLAGRKTTGVITGDVLFNGEVMSSEVRKRSAYVTQDTVLFGLLTVRQTMYFAAELRLIESMTLEEKDQRINEVLAMMGLEAVADTLVGNESVRGLSGGQLKRLSIAVEIIHYPDIMYLDEVSPSHLTIVHTCQDAN